MVDERGSGGNVMRLMVVYSFSLPSGKFANNESRNLGCQQFCQQGTDMIVQLSVEDDLAGHGFEQPEIR